LERPSRDHLYLPLE
nr:Chain B, NUCLEAR FACTOR OF ACTIVATED T-CELLS\, CYTOPLASMIC 3 [Homo sapiens]2XS0_B Chain B, NUCLEAR FACTOR OF ACTIVATED T-CELLS, CYTOPLASMIC 3 [Homo sapiens]